MGSTLPLILLYQYFNAVLRKITQLIHVDSRKVVSNTLCNLLPSPKTKLAIAMQSLPCAKNKKMAIALH